MSVTIKYSISLLLKQFLISNNKNMIISSENMMGLKLKDLHNIKAIIGNDIHIKIIAYCRNQIEHLPTHFLQKQKDIFQNPGDTINEFFKTYKNIYGSEHKFIINHWRKVFGKNKIFKNIFSKYADKGLIL